MTQYNDHNVTHNLALNLIYKKHCSRVRKVGKFDWHHSAISPSTPPPPPNPYPFATALHLPLILRYNSRPI